jgi:cytoskeletal protein CcmA (bactofilin family)
MSNSISSGGLSSQGGGLGNNPLTQGFKGDIPRRVVDVPSAPPKRVVPTGVEGAPAVLSAAAAASDLRKLVVGREISLSGEIAACDVLVVEGTVEAKLRDGRIIEIADGGLFKGSVEIDEADIGGRFQGDITVRGNLRVRSSGKIEGNVRYGTLEVESGGQLSGSIALLGTKPFGPGVTTTPPVVEPMPAPAPVVIPAATSVYSSDNSSD